MDPRQPVLVGVGRITHRDGDAPEPVDLMAEAVRRAASDSGGHELLGRVGSVRVVNLLSRRYPDPARLVADRLGIHVAHTVATTAGGQVPHQLVDRACDDLRDGRVDAVVIAGGESWRTRNRIKARGEASPWSTQGDDVLPSEVFGAPLAMVSDHEAALGLLDPVQAYPLVELALRARHHRSVAEQVDVAARLWAAMSEVAATNEHAAIRRPSSAQELCTPSATNRTVCFPYTKLMSSNSSVDQAAALVLCTAEAATAAGVPHDRWVFLHGAGEGNEVPWMSQRHDLASSPAIAAAGQAALDLAGIGLDDVAHVDLYSCFPSAVQVAAEALGLGLDRPLTVTGGLTFAGGPWNAYVVSSLAAMAEVLRADAGSYGLVSANGGFLTKHAVGIWSTAPPAAGTRWRSVQGQLDATVPRRPVAPDHEGPAALETWTVRHDQGGAPERAWAFVLTDDGRRALATTDDAATMAVLEGEGAVGATATVRAGELVSLG